MRLAAGLAAAPATADRAALGLAVIAEMGALVGDALRARAQAEISGSARSSGRRVWRTHRRPAERSGAERARDITAAVAALLADLAD